MAIKTHASRFLSLVQESKENVKLIDMDALHSNLRSNEAIHLFDVREKEEWLTGHIPKAIHLSKGLIERDIESLLPHGEHEKIIVYCSGGYRSVLVAENLQKMGYQNVYSLESGLRSWIERGYELSYP